MGEFFTAAPPRQRRSFARMAWPSEPKEALAAPRHQPQDCREVEEARLCQSKLVSFVVKAPSTYRTMDREDKLSHLRSRDDVEVDNLAPNDHRHGAK
jgi:hypothetical protein